MLATLTTRVSIMSVNYCRRIVLFCVSLFQTTTAAPLVRYTRFYVYRNFYQ